MFQRRRFAQLLFTLVAVLALGLVVGPAGPAASAEPPARASSGALLQGTLGGDAQFEGGCAWLSRGGARYQVWWPEGYHVEFEPLRLIDPAGQIVAVEGDLVTVRGHHVPDAVTVCQVGSVFDAHVVLR